MNNQLLKSHQNDILIFIAFLLLPWFLCYDLFSLNLMVMEDNLRSALPAYELASRKILTGSSLLWNEHILAGHPFLAEIVNGVLYPPKVLIYLILPNKWAYNFTVLFHFSLTGWFTYLYLRSINLSRTAGFFGGVLLMLSPIYRIQELDSISLLHTIAWFPLIMYFMEKRVATNQKKFLLFAALAFVLQVLAGFTQDAFYTAVVIVIYTAMRYYGKYQNFAMTFKDFFYDMIVFGLIVISFSAIQLLPTMELLSFTRHYQHGWYLIELLSAPPLGLLTFFSSFLWGGFQNGVGIQTHYFLKSFVMTSYMGILPIMFAIYALKFWRVKNVIKIWSVLLVLALVIAAGVYVLPVAKLLYEFPLTHDFRFHFRIYFVSSMAVVVLFAHAFDFVLKQEKNVMKQEIHKILKFGSAICFVMFVFTSGIIIGIRFFQGVSDKIGDQIVNGFQTFSDLLQYYQFHNVALFIPFFTFILGGILLWLLPITKKRGFILFGLWLIFVFDIGLVSSSFAHRQKSTYPYVDLILKLKPMLKVTDRVLTSAPNENYRVDMSESSSMVYNIQSLDGFVSFDEREIHSLKEGFTSLAILKGVPLILEMLHHRNDFLSMLGLKYFIVDKQYSKDVEKSSTYKKIFAMGNYVVYENPEVKDRIYSVNDIRWKGNVTNYSDLNLLNTAVLDKEVQDSSGLGIATIDQTIYKAGNVKTKVNCPEAKCLIVLSESYFPGWKAYVDGRKNKLYKVNDLILGTFVEKGEHWVKFYYFPKSVVIGICFFIFGLIWVPIWMLWRRREAR